MEESTKVLLLQLPGDHGGVVLFYLISYLIFCQMLFIIIMRNERKKGRRPNMKKIPQNAIFGHIFKKSPQPLFGAWSLLLVDIHFTSS